MLPVPSFRAAPVAVWQPTIDQSGSPSLALGANKFGAGLVNQFWRRKVIFFVVFALVMVAVIGALAVLPTKYVASGSVIIADQAPPANEASAAFEQKLGDPADLESQLLLIHSPRLLRMVLEHPDTQKAVAEECALSVRGSLKARFRPDNTCAKLLPGSDAQVDWVSDRYFASTLGRSRVIGVIYESASPEIAKLMANTLIDVYLKDEHDTLVETRRTTVEWLWHEIAQLNDGLRTADTALQSYRRDHGLIRGQLAPIGAEQMTSLAQQLASAQANQAAAYARLRESSGRGTDARAVLDSRTIEELKNQLSLVAAQLASASQTYGVNHPSYIALQRQRDDIAARLAAETREITAGAQRSYDAATAQVALLSRQLDVLKQDVGSAAGSEASIGNMVRDADIRRELYVELYKKASALETERRVLTSNARLVNYAELPSMASFPKKTPFIAGGLVAALVLGTAAAFLRDISDKTVRGSEALETLVGAPVLAQIPMARAERRGLRGNPVDVLEPCALQEAIRTLHAMLLLANGQRRLHTLLITSTAAQEGKTFTTLALAHFAAASGRRVLAIECDLRRPGFAAAIPLQNQPGLVDYLSGTANAVDILQASGTPGLHIIPAGTPRIGSTELLFGARFTDLLRATEGYDLVLLDSPPSELLMDARIIARSVDAVLFCAAFGRSDEAAVAEGIANLQRSGGDVLGLAVTMVRQHQYGHYNRRPLAKQPYLLAS